MSYLLQVHIGPVQSFIASARRTRDFWFGSELLSELARAAAQSLQQQGGTLIFPASADADNIPNKLIAVIGQQPSTVANNVHAAIKNRLGTIQQEAAVFEQLGKDNRDCAEAQLDDLVEYYWAAVPYERDYAAARIRLEALMAARKNTRSFQAVSWGRQQPKSSITGQLEAVVRPGDKGAKRGEYLSGVDLLKRKGKTESEARFFSTSHMAALPFLQRLETLESHVELHERWNNYIEKLKKKGINGETVHVPNAEPHPILGNTDGAMLYEGRLDEELADQNALTCVKKKLHAFLKAAQIGQPSPYYAIIHADGDGIGKVIAELATEPDGVEEHRTLSQALDAFAAQARSIAEEEQAAPVYIGGDDVLVLAPLHSVLACTNSIAQAFTDILSQKARVTATLSAGIAIVHHLVPLTDAIAIAERAEKQAKRVPGKNALAVIVSRRSGGEYAASGPRSELNSHLDILVRLHQEQALPHGAAYELRDLALRLPLPDKQQADAEALRPNLENARTYEAKRILKRKQTSKGSAIDEATIAPLLERLATLAAVSTSQHDPLEQLAHEMIIARECAAAQLLATGAPMQKDTVLIVKRNI